MNNYEIPEKFPYIVTGLFFLFGLLFGLGPDLVLLFLLEAGSRVIFWSTVSSLFFILLFALALYFTVSRLHSLLKLTRDHLEGQRERLSGIISHLPGIVFRCKLDESWTMLYMSDGVEELTGYRREELLYNREISFANLVLDEDNEEFKPVIKQHVEEQTPYTIEYRIRTKAGELKWIWEQARPVQDDRSDEVLLEGYLLDITDRKQAEQTAKSARNEALYQARHDSLTGLSSREWFLEEVDRRLDSDMDQNQAFCIVDIDNFKQVNDFYGHWVGNSLLRQIGNWLSEQKQENDFLGRLGGDEFGLLFPCSSDTDPIEEVKQRLETFEREFFAQGVSIHRSITVGIALFPEHGDNLEDIMAAANRAVNRCKNSSTERIALFQEEDRQHLKARISAAQEIMDALHDDRLEIQYQPITDTSTDSVTFQEALLRVANPEGEKLTMGNYWEVIHDGRITGRIDRWVARKVLEETSEYIGQEPFPRVGINLFPPSVVDQGYYEELEDLLDEYDFPRDKILLEVSEQLLQDDRQRASQMIQKIAQEKDFAFGLDDFGTGHGSFQTLKTLPFRCLKIDGSFINDLPNNEFDQDFIHTISNLCESLDINIIGEWIENEETAELLRDLGVFKQQGFYHARPQPLEHLV